MSSHDAVKCSTTEQNTNTNSNLRLKKDSWSDSAAQLQFDNVWCKVKSKSVFGVLLLYICCGCSKIFAAWFFEFSGSLDKNFSYTDDLVKTSSHLVVWKFCIFSWLKLRPSLVTNYIQLRIEVKTSVIAAKFVYGTSITYEFRQLLRFDKITKYNNPK